MPLGFIVAKQGLVPEVEVTRIVARQLRVPAVDLARFEVDAKILKLIPSDIAKRISQEIIDNGSATHGLLGASVQDASGIQGATTTGAYVAEAVSGGAAQAAGLAKGDIIIKVDGIPVTNSIDLTAQVRALAAGSTAEITYLRNGQEKTAEVTLGTMTQG